MIKFKIAFNMLSRARKNRRQRKKGEEENISYEE
jgi:hypothetical protein